MASDAATYTDNLSPELREKARRELNEDPDRRSADIEALRKLVKENKALHIKTDDAYLLRFLRARKFDVNRAYENIMALFRMKRDNPDFFNNLKPSTIRMVLEDGIGIILPDRDKEGRKVFLSRLGNWDPERYSMDKLLKTMYIVVGKLIQEEETQINGIILVHDLTNVGWSQLSNVTPTIARQYATLFQDCIPVRLKGFHYLNEPVIFDAISAIVNLFLTEKLRNRKHLHGANIEGLHEFIDKEKLPIDYGGTLPAVTVEETIESVMSSEKEFEEDLKYGLIENMTETNRNKQDAMASLPGTYTKLAD